MVARVRGVRFFTNTMILTGKNTLTVMCSSGAGVTDGACRDTAKAMGYASWWHYLDGLKRLGPKILKRLPQAKRRRSTVGRGKR